MSGENKTNESFADVTAVLQQQRPDLDPAFRDRLIFAAGRAAQRGASRPPVAWIAATIVLAVTSVSLGVSWWSVAAMRRVPSVAAPSQGERPDTAPWKAETRRDIVADEHRSAAVVVESRAPRDGAAGILRVADRSLDRVTPDWEQSVTVESSDASADDWALPPAANVICPITDLKELLNSI